MNIRNIQQNLTQHGPSIIVLLVLGLLILSLTMRKQAKGFSKNDVSKAQTAASI
ncbi:hypothetical protein MKQ68_24980 [Chitinophaga horti]|uniref:Uncharacterized protein n=1 Tax=Chitinophaga horti TaxID=2920382 RepID=A0ABY6J4W2_9BACT|nr:hypothetical protein [Chitinophaga horti]UYQ93341.1 hypothetical protein MKQ68_24980 [Chitinophaga horti]